MKRFILIALVAASCSKRADVANPTETNNTAPSLAAAQQSPNSQLLVNSTEGLASNNAVTLTNQAKYDTKVQTNRYGQIESVKVLDWAGQLKWVENYGYDSQSNLLSKKYITPDGKVTFFAYRYHADGSPAEVKVMGPDGREISPEQAAESFKR